MVPKRSVEPSDRTELDRGWNKYSCKEIFFPHFRHLNSDLILCRDALKHIGRPADTGFGMRMGYKKKKRKKKKRERDATVKTMLPVSPSTAVGTRASLGAAGGKRLSNLSDSRRHKFLNLTWLCQLSVLHCYGLELQEYTLSIRLQAIKWSPSSTIRNRATFATTQTHLLQLV